MYLKKTYKAYLKSKNETKTLISLTLFGLIAYANNSYISNSKNKKLIIEHYFFIYGAIVS